MSRKSKRRRGTKSKRVPQKPVCYNNAEKVKLTGIQFNIELYSSVPGEENISPKEEKLRKLLRIGNGFTTILQMLWKYVNSIGLLAETTSVTSLGTLTVLLDEINQIAKNRNDNPIAELEIEMHGVDETNEEKKHQQKVKIYDNSHLQKIIQFKQHNQAALSILHESSIQQLVNAWEKLIADIVCWYYENNPEKISDKHHLSYNKILQFSNLEEVKKSVIDAEIKNYLSLTTNEQIKFLNDTFGINFQSTYKETDLLNELILTRHLFVHCGGIATAEYVNKLAKLKSTILQKCEVGKKVTLNPSYIISSWGKIYVAGTELIHLIAKKIAPEHHELYNNFINNSAFQNIQKNQLDSAIKILEYAVSTYIEATKTLWIIKLNLAQAYKWNNEEDKCNDILYSSEWDVANSVFDLCVSSLRDEAEKFSCLLKEVASKKQLSITELYEWPIFQTMRDHENFEEWIEDAFGYKLNKYRELFEQKVLDCNPDITAKKLADYIQEKNNKI
ncbi:hypothetical protein ACTVJH_14625 [Desulfoplanes sp. PS50]